MKTRIYSIILLAIVSITTVFAADYAAISGEPISSLNKQTTLVSIQYDLSVAKVNGKTYSKYLTTLDAGQKEKYDKDIVKLKQYIIKQFNRTNKRGFQLTEQDTDYVAVVRINQLTFSSKKERAKFTATVDIKRKDSEQVITQIKFSNFEGAKKKGMYNQLKQLAKDIIEYLAIYL